MIKGWPFYFAIGAAMLLSGSVIVSYRGSRGLRNNNPGNIRKDGKTQWVGAVSAINGVTDEAFLQFKAPEYGIRALSRVLASYAKSGGLNTVPKIIARWAPPSENDTQAYVTAVLRRTGWLPSRVITALDYPALIAAIIHQENGSQPYPSALIQRGIDLA